MIFRGSEDYVDWSSRTTLLSRHRRIPSENDDTSMKGNETLAPKGWIVGLITFEVCELIRHAHLTIEIDLRPVRALGNPVAKSDECEFCTK